MRFIEMVDGRLEVRWTWLPYWLAAGPALHNELEVLVRDIVVLNALPISESSLDRIHRLIVRLIARRFRIGGLSEYLSGIQHVREA